ncbi:hypothetical protein L596_021861 [Steinernema carpocapsae]|uniref:Uncharacterized protein n=1 Tax=Steinernema carpocapsae TaxID=34508 RepID=A0A4U5MK42_STECR|nr:hypothetical protein L596_021861 [Steinernema carpocapsae]
MSKQAILVMTNRFPYASPSPTRMKDLASSHLISTMLRLTNPWRFFIFARQQRVFSTSTTVESKRRTVTSFYDEQVIQSVEGPKKDSRKKSKLRSRNKLKIHDRSFSLDQMRQRQ